MIEFFKDLNNLPILKSVNGGTDAAFCHDYNPNEWQMSFITILRNNQ